MIGKDFYTTASNTILNSDWSDFQKIILYFAWILSAQKQKFSYSAKFFKGRDWNSSGNLKGTKITI
eukprot:snap_masked-scaffold_17-processed-gene-3.32-mRNA-1 protein AED:1.00 eAED:1.00 QI:0/0/0/0/1/1/2/0/65